jgi:hypothetical protein
MSGQDLGWFVPTCAALVFKSLPSASQPYYIARFSMSISNVTTLLINIPTRLIYHVIS